MSPLKQRIALAELDGWDFNERTESFKKGKETAYCDGRDLHYLQIPQYLSDRNEIMRLIIEKITIPMMRRDFLDTLEKIKGLFRERPTRLGYVEARQWAMFTAAPEKLCEAVLRHFMLWKDETPCQECGCEKRDKGGALVCGCPNQ